MEFSKIVILLATMIFGALLVLDALSVTNGDMDTAKWFLALVYASYEIKSGIENKAKIEFNRDEARS